MFQKTCSDFLRSCEVQRRFGRITYIPLSPHVRESGIQLIFAVGIRNPETGIRNPPLWYGIRNPEGWNPESRCWDPEYRGWDPESRTFVDSLTWGDPYITWRFRDAFKLTWLRITYANLAGATCGVAGVPFRAREKSGDLSESDSNFIRSCTTWSVVDTA